jgi:hypothetical protein
MTFAAGEGYCLFDALAPSADQEFEYGVVATYSLDLIALAGLAATLSGCSENLQKLSAVEIVRALDNLKGRLTVLCQRGRIAVPRGSPSIIAQFARFIVEQEHNEQYGSWHPKVVLAAYHAKQQGNKYREWRLWIGSRNLSGAGDLEAGLVLVGSPTDERQNAPNGTADFFDFLLKPVWKQKARRDRIVSELTNHVRWRAPDGVQVEALHFWAGGSRLGTPMVDFATINARESVIISPFADAKGFELIANAIDVRRSKESRRFFLSTSQQLRQAELREVAKRFGFELKVFTPPAIDLGADGLMQAEVVASAADGLDGEPAEEECGLHSKIYLFRGRRGEKATLFIGSANVTGRALTGRNCEVLARLRVSDGIAESLLGFASGMPDWEEEPEDPAAAAALEILNNLRQDRNLTAATFKPQLYFESDGTITLRGKLPSFKTKDVAFSAALLTRLQFPVIWPSSATGIELARTLPKSDWTDLIAFELSVPGDDTLRTSWVQRIPAIGLTEETRRLCANAAIIRYLTPEELLNLAKAEMTGLPVKGTRGWTEKPTRQRRSASSHALEAPVSLEDILKARLRYPAQFSSESAIQMLERIIGAKQRMQEGAPEEYRLLAPIYENLERVWKVLVDN